MDRFALAIALALFLGACGGGDEPPTPEANSIEELENRLDALADRTTEEVAPKPRLELLKGSDLGDELRSDPACRLHTDGKLLLVVNAAGAVARVDDRRVPLTVAGPVGPSGGFFTAPGVTVSVGRETSVTPEAVDVEGASWRARVTVGGDKEKPVEKSDAMWACTGYARERPAGRSEAAPDLGAAAGG